MFRLRLLPQVEGGHFTLMTIKMHVLHLGTLWLSFEVVVFSPKGGMDALCMPGSMLFWTETGTQPAKRKNDSAIVPPEEVG